MESGSFGRDACFGRVIRHFLCALSGAYPIQRPISRLRRRLPGRARTRGEGGGGGGGYILCFRFAGIRLKEENIMLNSN